MSDRKPEAANPKVKQEQPLPERTDSGPRPSRFTGGGGPNRFGGPRRGGPQERDEKPPDLMSIDHGQDDNRPPGGRKMGGRGRGGGGGPQGGGRGNMGGPSGGGGGGGMPNQRDEMNRMRTDDRVNEKLGTMSGNTYELPQKEAGDQKFSSRCRLYCGNLVEINEEEVREMFKPFGEVSECFVNPEKMFAFVRLDYRASAERAKRELDGSTRKNRVLKVRFAPVGAAIRVKNLTPWVTNELLEYAFSIFGEIEHAQICVDERGNSLKEGIVEFARKPCALMALRRCSEGCFFLTSSLRPVVVEPYDVIDDIDGFPEKSITRKGPEYMKAREVGPRFATPASFEYDYGTRWKQLFELFKQKEEALKRELKLEEEKLEAQMEYARFEHETEMLREQLRQRELDRDHQKMEWEMKERQVEEQRLRDEELMRRHNEDMALRMHHQEDEMRRRQQENNMFMQMGRGEAPQGGFGESNGAPPDAIAIREYEALAAAGNLPADPKAFLDVFDRNPRFEGRGGDDQNSRGSRWGQPPPLVDEYHNKRRRY